jgi:hypothetical protein
VVAVAFGMAQVGTDAGDHGADARWHTRAGIPFFTGRRKPPVWLVADLA